MIKHQDRQLAKIVTKHIRQAKFKSGDKVQVIHARQRPDGHKHQRRMRQVGTITAVSFGVVGDSPDGHFYGVLFSDGEILGFRENELGRI